MARIALTIVLGEVEPIHLCCGKNHVVDGDLVRLARDADERDPPSFFPPLTLARSFLPSTRLNPFAEEKLQRR